LKINLEKSKWDFYFDDIDSVEAHHEQNDERTLGSCWYNLVSGLSGVRKMKVMKEKMPGKDAHDGGNGGGYHYDYYDDDNDIMMIWWQWWFKIMMIIIMRIWWLWW